MGKISNRFKRLFQDQLSSPVINLSAFKKGKEQAEENMKEIKGVDHLMELGSSPSEAIYLNVQNLTSVLVEELIMLAPAASMHRFFSKQQDLYMPGYPPMSPITNSYYFFWLQFDAYFGDGKETIGSCIRDLSDILPIEGLQKVALDNFCDSRMGIYKITKINLDHIFSVRELLTDKVYDVRFDKHFSGEVGDVVYTRVLPPLLENESHVLLGVPYQIVSYEESDWINYFRKYDIFPGQEDLELRLQAHMKHNKDRNYWIEYTFWAYAQHRPDVIYLSGLPDNKKTQPAHNLFKDHLKLSKGLETIRPRLSQPTRALTR